MIPCFLAIASFSPFSQALPNTLLWTWLGVMVIPYTSRLRLPVRRAVTTRPLWQARPERPVLVPVDIGPVRI